MDGPKTANSLNLKAAQAKNEGKSGNAKMAYMARGTLKRNGQERLGTAGGKGRGDSSSKMIEETVIVQEEELRNELDFFKKNSDEDSDFQFSQEIMSNNPRQENRRDREKGKLCHLSISDWMMRVSSMLRLTKECAYRGIIIMRKFMFLQQKKPPSRVTFINANLYAMACLLISNKFQNYSGNFLSTIVHIEGGSQNVTLEKEHILECELYIMTILQFNVVNHIFIVENLLDVVQEWNELAMRTPLCKYQLGRTKSMLQIWEGGRQEGGEENVRGDLLEVFLYLVDFATIRKLIELRIKEFKIVQDPYYFKKIIVNVLYHLILHSISKLGKQEEIIESKAFNHAFTSLITKMKLQRSQIAIFRRKSHLLSKEIRAIYSQTSKYQSLRKISSYHRACEKGFCICHISSLSKKYLNEEQITQKERIYDPFGENRMSKRQDQNETDPLINEHYIKEEEDEQVQIVPHDEAKKEIEVKQNCPVCLKNVTLLRSIINQQFYVSFLVKK